MSVITRRLLKYLVLVVAVVVIAGVATFRFAGIEIAYHKYQMRRAWGETFSESNASQIGGFQTCQIGESYVRYEYHRQRLVQLGVIRELNFEFQNIKGSTDRYREFEKFLVSSNRPQCIDFSMNYPKGPDPVHLTVWCDSMDVPTWTQLVTARDH